MAEYIDRTDVLDEINRIGVNAFRDYSDYSNLFDFVASVPAEFTDANIVERSKIDKAIEKIQRHMQELYTLDYKQLIEYATYKDCLKILKKHIGGAEDASCN